MGLSFTICGLVMVLSFLGTLIAAFFPPYMKDSYHSEEFINDFNGQIGAFNMSTSNFMPSISMHLVSDTDEAKDALDSLDIWPDGDIIKKLDGLGACKFNCLDQQTSILDIDG